MDEHLHSNIAVSWSTKDRTIPEIATSFGVCESSVRNWIKTGYLETTPNGDISNQSLVKFRDEIVGKEKLNKRANKLHAGLHVQIGLEISAIEAISNSVELEKLSTDYETSLTTAHRNREGIYYTPEDICKSMLVEFLNPLPETTFCDPCCGSGNFIMEAIKRGIHPENVFGFDTDPMAIAFTKQRILNETGYRTDQIICADFLEEVAKSSKSKNLYDIIATNPPWGRKIQKKIRLEFGDLLNAGSNVNSISLFIFAMLKVLKDDGYLALLLPDTFFKIATFQELRHTLLNFELISATNYGKRFEGIISKAQSFTMKKTKKKTEHIKCIVNHRAHDRLQNTFIMNPLQIINFECNSKDSEVIARIFEKPNITLSGNARWGLGIVTGNNKKYCTDKYDENLIPVLRGKDIHKGYIDKPKAFIPCDFTQYQQVTSPKIFEAKSKIMYRFISNDLVFYHDLNQAYCLNSVNMIVVDNNFQISSENLVKFFNSNLINWVYKKLFNTHKVLRSDLEKFPLPKEVLIKSNFTEFDLLRYYGIEYCDDGTYQIDC